jgi:hypothetical protein
MQVEMACRPLLKNVNGAFMGSKTFKVKYIGGQISQANESFTINSVYLARMIREDVLIVLNDQGVIEEMSVVDFEICENKQNLFEVS